MNSPLTSVALLGITFALAFAGSMPGLEIIQHKGPCTTDGQCSGKMVCVDDKERNMPNVGVAIFKTCLCPEGTTFNATSPERCVANNGSSTTTSTGTSGTTSADGEVVSGAESMFTLNTFAIAASGILLLVR